MKIIALIFSLILVSACSDNSANYSLSAGSGDFSYKDISVSSRTQSITAILNFEIFVENKEWPPATYLGFYQGENRNESIQFLIIRNEVTDKHYLAGYRLIKHGKEVKLVTLKQKKLKESTKVKMGFTNGLVSIAIDDDEPVEIQTHMEEVKAYISVSSCLANFKITNNQGN